MEYANLSHKKLHFCMFLYVFACESFILAHRLDGLDGFLMGSTIDNNQPTIISSRYHAKQGTNYLFVKNDQKWGKNNNYAKNGDKNIAKMHDERKRTWNVRTETLQRRCKAVRG